ncbi:MAG: aspartyl-tRNA synthetase [Actinomycetota bacterium]|nr:aspartyl-tRNA synthetase [Actinomycetota bacterium]
MIRTREAGTLRRSDAGTTVTLAGWVARRRDLGGVAFVDLRDASGIAQVVFREGDVAEAAQRLRSEYCVRVVGEVRQRPAGNENPELPTGEIEVVATELEVLSEAAPLPFPVVGTADINEESRLKYRYLDLRREGPARALRVRSDVNRIARDVMAKHRFVEVETPNLTRSTPEGARDFLVPVRLQPGHWYALPQSPQLFKQLLMVAGMERYFQIARCFRDEDFRADRQPEFTQLDIEMSFIDQDDIIALAEDVVSTLWREVLGYDVPLPIPRITYADAMSRYGSDKPDLRFGNELVDSTAFFADTPFRVFQAPYVGAVVMPGGASQSRKELDAWADWAKARGAKGLAYVLVGDDGEISGPVAKNISDAERAGVAAHVGASPGDAVFFAAGERTASLELLGAARLEIGRRGDLIDDSRWEFVWVVDAPMFEPDGDGGWTAVHHPFTSPKPEFADSFHESPGEALAYAYDIVLNGSEIGGGSIRIHRGEMQQRVFDVIGLTKDEAEAKFGFLLEAFTYGPPPHGGIALGWDRVLTMLTGTESIREVIAFPKTASGGDPLTGAPTPITDRQRKEAGIDAVVKPAAGAALSTDDSGR